MDIYLTVNIWTDSIWSVGMNKVWLREFRTIVDITRMDSFDSNINTRTYMGGPYFDQAVRALKKRPQVIFRSACDIGTMICRSTCSFLRRHALDSWHIPGCARDIYWETYILRWSKIWVLGNSMKSIQKK